MDPIIGASLISAGGSLLGGLLGSSSSSKEASKNRKEARRQFDLNMDFNKNATQYRVQDALKAGINPLAALGVSYNVLPTFSAGGSSDSGYQKGNAITRAAEYLSNIFNRQEKESRDLDLEAKRIRNDTMRAELDVLRQPGLIDGNASMEQPPIGTDSMLFRVSHDLHGRPRLVVNQDVTENDSDNAAYRSTIASAIANGQIDKFSGRVKSPQVRMMLDDMHYRATGRYIPNLEELYISPTEVALVLADEIKDLIPRRK